MFWLAKIRNNSVKRVGNQTVRLRVADLPEIDTFTFYNPVPPTLPGVPSVTSFEQTWTKSGSPRQINPTSADPISAFNWAGRMWKATSSIRFTVAYADGSFSAQGTGSSSATDFGEMGFERNGVFLQDDSGGQGENQAIE